MRLYLFQMQFNPNIINRFKNYLNFTIVVLLLNNNSFSQTDSSNYSSTPPPSVFVIQPQIHIGKVLKIYPVFPKTDFAALNEINIAIQTAGCKEWHRSFHYPQVGIALFYGYLGNNAILGHNFGIVPNLAFNNRRGKRFWLQTRFGMGFAYFTKHYNEISNPTNLVIGASVNNMTFLSLDGNFKLSSHFNLNIGAAMYHLSDGHYQLPNLGANIPTGTIGISYFTKSKPVYYKRDSLTHPSRKVLFTVNLGYGRHEFGSATKATGGPKYNVYHGAFYLSKRWRQINNLHAGVYVTYYSDYYDFIINQETFSQQQRMKAGVITLFLGDEFMIGKFGLVMQTGGNIYSPFLKEYFKETNKKGDELLGAYITNKIGIQYYFTNPYKTTSNKLFVGMYLKANFAEADFAEIAMGYTF